jgi:hypothetical protein
MYGILTKLIITKLNGDEKAINMNLVSLPLTFGG